jgi:hypothetical protein
MSDGMDDKERRAAFMSALTTEHFVMQTALGVTINEAGSRASIYVFALSSSLVAMGFVAQSPDALVPFVATVLPALFVLGIFTILRMVDIAAENMQAHIGIARIRAYYRTLNAEAEEYFAADRGRWPEAASGEPSLRVGPLVGYLTTAAIMIAAINAMVAAAGVSLVAQHLLGVALITSLLIGAICAAIFLALFFSYQRRRISELVDASASLGSTDLNRPERSSPP